MILRSDTEIKFKLTKQHNIPYILHSYCTLNIKNKIFENIEFIQNDWNQKEFRMSFINWYFNNNNNNSSESECLTYIKKN